MNNSKKVSKSKRTKKPQKDKDSSMTVHGFIARGEKPSLIVYSQEHNGQYLTHVRMGIMGQDGAKPFFLKIGVALHSREIKEVRQLLHLAQKNSKPAGKCLLPETPVEKPDRFIIYKTKPAKKRVRLRFVETGESRARKTGGK